MRRRGIAIAFAIALCSIAAPGASAAKDDTVWLCKPGLANNPCKPGFGTTTISPAGEIVGPQKVKRDRHPAADCFYVYPTVSDDETRNSDLEIDPEERSIALYQAARYGLHCRVFAPMYRQITLQALFSGQPPTPEERQTAYGDVVDAWKTYLANYNDGRGVILIGHSQGTYVLRQLIHDYVDPKRGVRKRLISAYLLGGNVLVREGSTAGGDFRRIPACEAPREIHCAIAFSTFNAPVPADARFGRATTDLDGNPATGQEVLCTNPAGSAVAPARCAPSIPASRTRRGRRSARPPTPSACHGPRSRRPGSRPTPTPGSARRRTAPTSCRSPRSTMRRSSTPFRTTRGASTWSTATSRSAA